MAGAFRGLLTDLARLSLSSSSTISHGGRSLLGMTSSFRLFTTSNRLMDSIRDNHRQGTKLAGAQQESFEGTAGAGQSVSVNVNSLDARLPTAETMKQEFDGVPYNELPIVYIKATKNNTLVHVTDHKNNMITYTSCRLEGFKNARKKTNIAGQTTGVAAGQRLVRRGIRQVRVQVKGIGPGRMTCVKGLTVAGVQVISITDHTALCELGPRPRKIRRI